MKRLFKNIIRFFIFLFLTLIIALIFIPDNNKIDILGNSMHPTYNTGDNLLYQRYDGKAIEKGDILIFNIETAKRYPNYIKDPNCPFTVDKEKGCYRDNTVLYIKRIAGVKGDKISIVNNVVYINDKKENFSSALTLSDLKSKNDATLIEDKKSNYRYKYNKDYDYYISDLIGRERAIPNKNYGVLEKGEYFVLGDNRDYSYDSRKLGIIDENLIVGYITK